MQTQFFDIASNGIVRSGKASYSADLTTGGLSWQASAEVGFLFLTKTFSFSGFYQVNPLLLKSSAFQKGEVLNFGNLAISIIQIDNNVADVDLDLTGSVSGTGNGLIDLSKPNIIVRELKVVVHVAGLSLILEANPMPMSYIHPPNLGLKALQFVHNKITGR